MSDRSRLRATWAVASITHSTDRRREWIGRGARLQSEQIRELVDQPLQPPREALPSAFTSANVFGKKSRDLVGGVGSRVVPERLYPVVQLISGLRSPWLEFGCSPRVCGVAGTCTRTGREAATPRHVHHADRWPGRSRAGAGRAGAASGLARQADDPPAGDYKLLFALSR